MRVFVAGAAGQVGSRLVPLLVAHGHQVTGTTRRPDRLERIRALGADAVLLDGLDAAAVGQAVAHAEPDAIVHEMTSLTAAPDMRRFDRWFAGTNELRTRGTDHLLAAAQAVGVRRLVVQSYAGWNNERSGGAVKSEGDPMDRMPARGQTRTLDAIHYMERAVLEAPREGIVLRYANFYGPGTLEPFVELLRRRRFPVIGDGAGVWSWLHLDDAADATVAALERGRPGVYNVADDDPAPVAVWLPYLAELAGAKPPLSVPRWLGRLLAGDVAVRWMTEGRGSSNAKAKDELGWAPAWPSWRDGFRDALGISGSAVPRTGVAA